MKFAIFIYSSQCNNDILHACFELKLFDSFDSDDHANHFY